jgi:hypothetical protein
MMVYVGSAHLQNMGTSVNEKQNCFQMVAWATNIVAGLLEFKTCKWQYLKL